MLEYRFEGDLRLIAKRYARPDEALAGFEVLRILWAQGFGPGSAHRVPEPLGCFIDHGVLLMGIAPGVRLATLATDSGPWFEGLRAAAGWLARLHAVSLDLGAPQEDIAQGVFRLARRATRAGARHPEAQGLIVGLFEELAHRARDLSGSGSRGPTHGRYHAGHVFIAPDSVAVIDLDRVALADPAKDVGEFFHRLRSETRSARLQDADIEHAWLVFLEAYVGCAGGIPTGLTYYWSYSILAALLRAVELSEARWEKRMESYRAEFADIPERAATLSRLLRKAGSDPRVPRVPSGRARATV